MGEGWRWAEGDSAELDSGLFSFLNSTVHNIFYPVETLPVWCVCGDFEVRINKKFQEVAGKDLLSSSALVCSSLIYCPVPVPGHR